LYKTKFGQVGYNTANEFLDAFAQSRMFVEGTFVVAINWSDWGDVGMSVEAVKHRDRSSGTLSDSAEPHYSMSVAEAIEAFNRVLACPFPRIAVSTQDLVEMVRTGQHGLEWVLRANPDGPKLARPELTTDYSAPCGPTEETLADIWREFLGLDQVGVHDNFFELGGHSLLGARIIARIREKLHIALPLRVFFDNPTIGQQALVIDEEEIEQFDDRVVAATLAQIESVPANEAEQLVSVLERGSLHEISKTK